MDMTHRQKLQALSGLLLALFIATLSATVVTTALPRMVADLDGSQASSTWVITATLLATTVSLPIWGKLADLFSKKIMLQAAAVTFSAGSLAAGLSQNMGELIAARAIQGIGVGGLQALVMISIGAMISPRERGRYSGYQSSVTAVATIGGPLLGGVIVDTGWLGWRWCFFVSLPIAAVALVILQRTLNLPLVRSGKVKIDYLGAGLLSAGVSTLLIWVSFVGDSFAWGSSQTAVLVGSSALLLALAVVVELRVSEPLVPLGILRQRSVALAILGSLAAGTAMFGATVFMSQYFQMARGYSPTQAGLLTIPMMAGILVSSLVGGQILSRVGAIKPFLLVGTISLTAGFACLSQIGAMTNLVLVSGGMVLVGTGIGLTAQNFILLVQNSVPLRILGSSTATVSFFRSLGGTVGVAVLGAVLANRAGDDPGAAGAPTVFGDAIAHIFTISAIIALVGVMAVLALRPVHLRSTLELRTAPPVPSPAAGTPT